MFRAPNYVLCTAVIYISRVCVCVCVRVCVVAIRSDASAEYANSSASSMEVILHGNAPFAWPPNSAPQIPWKHRRRIRSGIFFTYNLAGNFYLPSPSDQSFPTTWHIVLRSIISAVVYEVTDRFPNLFIHENNIYLSIYLSLVVQKAQKHNVAIKYSGQDSETIVVLNTAITIDAKCILLCICKNVKKYIIRKIFYVVYIWWLLLVFVRYTCLILHLKHEALIRQKTVLFAIT